LNVYCEDDFAAQVINASLTHGLRQRVGVYAIGADSELPGVCGFHKRIGLAEKALVLWDGDVPTERAQSFIRKHLSPEDAADSHFNWSFLPGDTAPEAWVVEQLQTTEGTGCLVLSCVPSGLKSRAWCKVCVRLGTVTTWTLSLRKALASIASKRVDDSLMQSRTCRRARSKC
jgi:hypothetical protein